MSTNEFRPLPSHEELLRQIGVANLAAISGLRVERRETGVTLPVGHGYRVTVDYAWDDTYVVRRVFERGAKTWIKGEESNVDCFQVGETAYRASCYVNVPFGDYDPEALTASSAASSATVAPLLGVES